MSDCKICFHKGDGRVMQRPVSGECERCNPRPVLDPIEDACVCPPLGEPRGGGGNSMWLVRRRVPFFRVNRSI